MKTFLRLFILVLTFSAPSLLVGQFSGSGSGTELDPYIITTPAQLDEVRNDLNAFYELGNDIDMTFDTQDPSGAFYDGGKGWLPIPFPASFSSTPFSGSFDGKGFSIIGLQIDRGIAPQAEASDYLGLFSKIGETPTPTGNPRSGEIRNLSIEAFVNGGNLIGGLVGYALATTNISNCHVSGSLMGLNNSGGLVGNSDGSITECSSSAAVVGNGSVGGIVGSLSGTMQRCFATGNVSGIDNVGGLIGIFDNGFVFDSYSTGEVSVRLPDYRNNSGGAIGYITTTNSPIAQRVYATGTVTFEDGTTGNGALGRNRFGTVINASQTSSVYFDFSSCNFRTTANYGVGKTSSEMSMQATFEDFDFNTIWSIDEGSSYPYLQWQSAAQSFNLPSVDIADPTPDLANLPDLVVECEVLIAPNIPTATDACGRTLDGTTDAAFPISEQGTVTITWTYESLNGEVTTQDQNLIIEDTTPPEPGELSDFESTCSVNSAAVIGIPSAPDNCGGFFGGSTDALFPISAQGTTTITWTFTDSNGNSSTRDQNIIISDVEAPAPNFQELTPLTSNCDGSVSEPSTVPVAVDNCAGVISGSADVTFPFSPGSDTQITWTYDDGNGNTSTQTQDVIVRSTDQSMVEESLCEGSSFTFPDGTEWTGQTSQVSTLTNQLGCDSVITTNVTILNTPEVVLNGDPNGCTGQELTFSIDESAVSFETYTISTLFGNTSTDGPLTFTFDETFAATLVSQEVFVTVELTSPDGCVGTDQIQLTDNSLLNWAIGSVQNSDPSIFISNTVLPDNADSFEWDFGDGSTNSTQVNPSHTYTENGNFTITLTVTNECGSESLTTTATISSISTPLAVENSVISVYPNPTTKAIHIEGVQKGIFRIFGLDGKLNLTGELQDQQTIDISQLQKGQYMLQVLEDGKPMQTTKIIKIN